MIPDAYDLETHLRQPGLATPPIVCGSTADDNGAHLLDRKGAIEWLRGKLKRREPIVGANIVFDLATSCADDPDLIDLVFEAIDAGLVHDVAIREALLDIARGEMPERGEAGEEGQRYSLTMLVERYLGIDISAEKKGGDAWRKRYAQLDGVPLADWPWEARVYPLRDAAFTREVYIRQQEHWHDNLRDEAAQVRADFALELISVWGLRTNAARVAALDAKVEAEWEKARAEFTAHGIFRPDGTKNMKRLGELITAAYARIGAEAPKTKTGTATDRDTLIESGDELLERLGKSGKNDKRKTTYLPKLKQGLDVPWNPSFNVLVATTRVSSDAQQFPSDGGIRECFEPRPGYCFCSVDYGGLELRTMSQRAIWQLGYSRMAESLNAGKDCHTIAASSFMGGVTYAELLPRVEAKEKVAVQFRQLGKIYNFGKGGGMGPGAMTYNARTGKNGETTTGPDGKVYTGVRFCILIGGATRCGDEKIEITVMRKKKMVCAACIDVARQLDKGWLRAWEEQAELFKMASGFTAHGSRVDVEIPGGEHPIVRGQCGYTQFLNTPFQGLGARVVKDAMWRVSRECYVDRRSPLYGSRLVLNVHDELIAELLLSQAHEAAERMALIMRETACQWMPDLGPSIEADPAISVVLSKSMKTVRDASGRLQLWKP